MRPSLLNIARRRLLGMPIRDNGRPSQRWIGELRDRNPFVWFVFFKVPGWVHYQWWYGPLQPGRWFWFTFVDRQHVLKLKIPPLHHHPETRLVAAFCAVADGIVERSGGPQRARQMLLDAVGRASENPRFYGVSPALTAFMCAYVLQQWRQVATLEDLSYPPEDVRLIMAQMVEHMDNL